MGDYMTLDRLVAMVDAFIRCDSLCEGCEIDDDHGMPCRECREQAADRIEEIIMDNERQCAEEHRQLAEWLKELKRYQWIPVSERLPIPPTFCLVTTDGRHGDVIDIALYMSDGWHKASEVLAWMPLPPPYEGGETV